MFDDPENGEDLKILSDLMSDYLHKAYVARQKAAQYEEISKKYYQIAGDLMDSLAIDMISFPGN